MGPLPPLSSVCWDLTPIGALDVAEVAAATPAAENCGDVTCDSTYPWLIQHVIMAECHRAVKRGAPDCWMWHCRSPMGIVGEVRSVGSKTTVGQLMIGPLIPEIPEAPGRLVVKNIVQFDTVNICEL